LRVDENNELFKKSEPTFFAVVAMSVLSFNGALSSGTVALPATKPLFLSSLSSDEESASAHLVVILI